MRKFFSPAAMGCTLGVGMFLVLPASAAPKNATYGGYYSGCSQGVTPAVLDFAVTPAGAVSLYVIIYNIPGFSNDIPTVMFKWTGTINLSNYALNLSKVAILGNSSNYVVAPTTGALSSNGSTLSIRLCGATQTFKLVPGGS